MARKFRPEYLKRMSFEKFWDGARKFFLDIEYAAARDHFKDWLIDSGWRERKIEELMELDIEDLKYLGIYDDLKEEYKNWKERYMEKLGIVVSRLVDNLVRRGHIDVAFELAVAAGKKIKVRYLTVKNPWIENGRIYLVINKKEYGYAPKKGYGGAKVIVEKFKEKRRKEGIGKALAWFKTVTILKEREGKPVRDTKTRRRR